MSESRKTVGLWAAVASITPLREYTAADFDHMLAVEDCMREVGRGRFSHPQERKRAMLRAGVMRRDELMPAKVA